MAIPDIRLEDVEAFHQSIAAGSMSAAARVLGRPAKQVGRQITRLEEALGYQLLQRTTSALSLTAHGRRFVEVAGRLLRVGAEGVELLEDDPNALSGELRVVVPSLNLGVTSWVRALTLAHRGMRLRVETADEPVDLVAAGMDLQLSVRRPIHSTSIFRRLHVLRSQLAAHRDYLSDKELPTRPEQLESLNSLLWVTDAPQRHWSLLGHDGTQIDVPVQGTFHTSSSALLHGALLDGLGVGPVGRAFLRDRGPELQLVPILPAWEFEPTPIYAVYPPSRQRSPLVAAFVDKAAEGLAAWF